MSAVLQKDLLGLIQPPVPILNGETSERAIAPIPLYLGDDQQAAVHDIGERPCGKAHKKNGQRCRRLHQRDQEGRRGEPRHEPHAHHILEPGPDISRQGREPDSPENSNVQRCPF